MGSHDASNRPLLDYDHGSVRTTWIISFKEIERQSLSAANLLRLWAFLDNKQLWHGLLTVTGDSGGAQRWWPQWLSEMGGNIVRFLDAVGLLLRYSMIETEQGSKASYSMHPVVHQWASYIDGKRYDDEWLTLALAVVGQSMPTLETREYWVELRKLTPHAEMVWKWIQKADVSRWYIRDDLVIDSLHMLAVIYQNQCKFAEAEVIFNLALEGHEKMFEHNHGRMFDTINNLGNLYRDQGKLAEAEAMYKRALEGHEKAVGRDHVSTLGVVGNLGLLYMVQGKLAQAEAMYNRVLEGCEKAPEQDATLRLDTFKHLGVLYAEQGEFAQAEAMHDRALQGYEKAVGRDHVCTLSTANNFGMLYAEQGEFAQAEAMYKRALEGYEKTLGQDCTATLDTINNLANLYIQQGKLAEAWAMHERKLRILLNTTWNFCTTTEVRGHSTMILFKLLTTK
jgi:tetratricopeptide (TPR) repeat protein